MIVTLHLSFTIAKGIEGKPAPLPTSHNVFILLKELLKFARKGDTVYCESISRIARNIGRVLGLNIDLDELYNEFSYKLVNNNKKKKNLLIEELGIDLTKKAMNNELDPVVGRDNEIKRLLEVLSRRTKNNPILIGEAGVGKTAIVEELSRLIVTGDVPLNLKNKRIIALDMASAVAGTKYRGEFEDRMRKVLKEIEDNPDIILFIDEVHTLVGAGGAEGAIDASNIFKPALARNKLRCIGATTISEYKKFIEPDSALERRFQKIIVDVPNKETVKEILYKIKSIYERYHLVSVDDNILDLIIDLIMNFLKKIPRLFRLKHQYLLKRWIVLNIFKIIRL